MKRYLDQENFQMFETYRYVTIVVVTISFLFSVSIWSQSTTESPSTVTSEEVSNSISKETQTTEADDSVTPVITKTSVTELSAADLQDYLLRIDEFSEEQEMVILLEVQRRDNENDRPIDRSSIGSSFGKKVVAEDVEVATDDDALPRLEETAMNPPISVPYTDSEPPITSDPRDTRNRKETNTGRKPAYVPKKKKN